MLGDLSDEDEYEDEDDDDEEEGLKRKIARLRREVEEVKEVVGRRRMQKEKQGEKEEDEEDEAGVASLGKVLEDIKISGRGGGVGSAEAELKKQLAREIGVDGEGLPSGPLSTASLAGTNGVRWSICFLLSLMLFFTIRWGKPNTDSLHSRILRPNHHYHKHHQLPSSKPHLSTHDSRSSRMRSVSLHHHHHPPHPY